MRQRLMRAGLSRLLVVAAAAGAFACDRAPDSQDYAAADQAANRAMQGGAEWPSYGRDHSNQRFSPLSEITAANVADLQLAWQFHTGISQAFEASPIVVNGIMYISTALNHVFALDARTGERKWEYIHPLRTTIHCCGPVNRGVAVYDGKVYLSTLDAALVALDARNGHVVWQTQVDDNTHAYGMTLPPVVVRGKVLVGVNGAEYGIRGHADAYDARTGRHIWRFYTVPSPEEGGWWGKWATTDPFGTSLGRNIAQEKRDSATYPDAWKRGGGSIWQAPAIDTTLGLVLWNVNNPSPDVDGTVRPGDNLYTDCLVALDLETGKLKWYFQEVPHDVWDYDPISPVVMVETTDSAGRPAHAVAQAGKTGWVYVVDRATGRPIRRSEAFVPQKNMFAQPTRAGTFIQPGGNGGSEWSASAYSPETGYMYVLGLNEHDLYKLRPERYAPPASWLSGVWYTVTGKSDNGTFTAIDLATGRIAWQKVLPDPLVGGTLATQGGIVFLGTKDKRFIAYDARSGQELWTYAAHAGVNAPPISYAINGRQYVAVAAGGNFQINAPRGDEVLAFALPRTPQSSAAGQSSAARGR